MQARDGHVWEGPRGRQPQAGRAIQNAGCEVHHGEEASVDWSKVMGID